MVHNVNNKTHLSINHWVDDLSNNEMPIFGQTVQDIINVSENDISSALHLGEVVLKDASMTARILKLANSVHYNTTGRKFSTISQSIMMLGFNTVRNLSLTVSLIDRLSKGTQRDQLIKQMIRSMLASVQAQEIAKQAGDSKHEEVFIAALLFNVGELAFWCFSNPSSEKLSTELNKKNITQEQAEIAVLGFTMNDLSQGIAKAWGLSDLLQETLKSRDSTLPRNQAITLSHKLAASIESGWESDEVKAIIQSVSTLINLPIKETTEQLHQLATKTAKTIAMYGAKKIADKVTLPNKIELNETVTIVNTSTEPDSQLQLQILQDLMSLSKEKIDFNMLIEMTLEGIYRGVGMDHALFALLSPDRKQLVVKQVLGDNGDWLREHFKFNLNTAQARIWLHSFKEQLPLRIDEGSPINIKKLVSAPLTDTLKATAFYVSPLIVKNKPIGLLYADRSLQRRSLDDKSFDSFDLFSQQINMVLNRMMKA